MSEPRPKSDLQIIAGYFGKKDGHTLQDLVAEFKHLTDLDKSQLVAGITDGTLTYLDSDA